MRIEKIRPPEFPVWSSNQIQEYIRSVFLETDLNHYKDVLLIVDDHTRPNTCVPRMVLEQLIDIVGSERVAVLVASGLHRASSYQEIENKIGFNAKQVRLYTHNPMTTPSPFLGNDYFRIGVNTVLPHLHTGFTACGKLILPGIVNHVSTVSFHEWSGDDALCSMLERNEYFDIGFNAYINDFNSIVHLERQSREDVFREEYYTVLFPKPADVAILIPSVKWKDFQQTMNCVNLLQHTSAVKPGGILAFYSSTPEGIGIHYLYQQPNGIKPVKYDEVFSRYLKNKTLAFIMRNVSERAIQQYFNQRIFLHENLDDFYAYVKFIYGDDATVNVFYGADMMIGRENEQS